MLTITVAQDGSGNFASIGEAVMAVPYDTPARILIGPGTYREKLVCEKQQITLKGAGMEQTRLVWNDGGKLPHRDGRPTHTFRSWTAFFSGDDLTVEDMTIQNDAGPGAQVGQAIAAYVDSRRAAFRHVRLLGNQDTLFCAPLPEKEREKDGFLGPRVFAPRRPSAQYYQGCVIEGDIDFIFGGGDCLNSAWCARWTTDPAGKAAAMSPLRPPRRMGWGSYFGTATLCRTVPPARCIWAGPGVPPARPRYWSAGWASTLRRRASAPGTTARTGTKPSLQRRATPAPAPKSGRGAW